MSTGIGVTVWDLMREADRVRDELGANPETGLGQKLTLGDLVFGPIPGTVFGTEPAFSGLMGSVLPDTHPGPESAMLIERILREVHERRSIPGEIRQDSTMSWFFVWADHHCEGDGWLR